MTAQTTPEPHTQTDMQIHKDIYHLQHYVLILLADYLLLLDLFRRNEQMVNTLTPGEEEQ